MAYPGTMTAEQQASHDAWMTHIMRPATADFVRALNHIKVGYLEYNGPQNNTNGNMSRIDDADVIPVGSSGLDGAEPVAKTKVLTLLTFFGNLLAAYNTDEQRTLYAEVAGESALIG